MGAHKLKKLYGASVCLCCHSDRTKLGDWEDIRTRLKGHGWLREPVEAVLNLMMEKKIVNRNQARYHMNTNRLAEFTSMTYSDFLTRNFTDEAIALIANALL